MKKELKDYLHLYLGCKVICDNKDCFSDFEYYGQKSNNSALLLKKHLNGNWKPILRHLSDMTEDEKKKYYTIKGKNAFNPHEPYSTLFLLAYHFDLFDLIPSGLAIDATTLKETNPAT